MATMFERIEKKKARCPLFGCFRLLTADFSDHCPKIVNPKAQKIIKKKQKNIPICEMAEMLRRSMVIQFDKDSKL